MTHRDSIRDSNGGKLARRAVCLLDAQLDRLCLAVECNVARGSFIPAGRHANEGLCDVFF